MTVPFSLGTAQVRGAPTPVLRLADGALLDIPAALARTETRAPTHAGPLTTLAMLEAWDAWLDTLDALAQRPDAAPLPADTPLLAPILFPRKLLMAGANYSDHIAEMKAPMPDKSTHRPFFFPKLPSVCIVGPGAPIELPPGVRNADWEAELVAVIGRSARQVKARDAMAHVAGYTVGNDISARDRQGRKDWGGIFANDWMLGKCWQTFNPLGPTVVPAAFVPDPYCLRITCDVSGRRMQDSTTANLIFRVDEMIEYLSELFTLEPGDCISTGTPPGVGLPRGVFLADGDTLVTEVEGVGRL
jgi:2-keto-4-pentenoate hydratase/2-oxohepta-3-ene-1,7-dioic acid hydratase in catechol pathway